MSAESTPNITGDEIVDVLQGVQKLADTIDNPDKKITYVRQALALTAARSLLGSQMMVTSSLVLAKNPDLPPDERHLFSHGLVFVAELSAFGYLFDQDIPIDSLALTFPWPEVLDVEPGDAPAMRSLTFQVPVLAIDSCFNLAAA